ncbi:MAG: UDP-N-acetylglucosamine 2-epimerase (non-hydrolyzing) [Myxococcota bacterium]|nr:UDP-N-acetylglucosamine 2-epimerase (non-hydrolyzing) [Myxococcota bacterium]
MASPLTLCFVAGARPNFPKIAPILAALAGQEEIRTLLVHTGQHYDAELSDVFFEDLGMPAPDWSLGVGSGSHASQTAAIMVAFEARCMEERPDAVVVVGDVNSTVACALVAAKLLIPVVHVEAGLRSGDRTMPEELNRIVTDTLSDRLYTHCREADDNLAAEGISQDRIVLAGNVMIDSLLRLRERSRRPAGPETGLDLSEPFGLVTLHRPALVDDAGKLTEMLEALASLAEDLPLLYPVHPRTRRRMTEFGLAPAGEASCSFRNSRLVLAPQLRYLEFLWLLDHARLVLTDSGGIQEETTVLGVPCLTVRENTERAVTIRQGTNQLVGLEPSRLLDAARAVLAQPMPTADRVPEGWDGRSGQRIAEDLVHWLRSRAGSHTP